MDRARVQSASLSDCPSSMESHSENRHLSPQGGHHHEGDAQSAGHLCERSALGRTRPRERKYPMRRIVALGVLTSVLIAQPTAAQWAVVDATNLVQNTT